MNICALQILTYTQACVSIKNIITGKMGYLPLGSMANRQGRVIGTNLAGGTATFPGYVRTWAIKLFDLSFCGAGLTAERAAAEGFDALGVGVAQLERLEVAYAPPFAAAMDIVSVAGNVAENVLAGRFTPVTGEALMELWQKRDKNKVFFIDSRPAAGRVVEASHPDWHSIPLEEIAARIAEVPRDRPVALICNTGLRAYDSSFWPATALQTWVNAMGGMQSVRNLKS